MKKTSTTLAATLALAMTLGLAACDREGPAERAGKNLDNAAERAGNAVERAGDKTKDAIDNAKK